MRRLLLGLAFAALILPAAATGGGFATVQLSSLPDGAEGGGTWTPTMTILQHDLTPLDALHPVARISDGQALIDQGLKSGEVVVVDGQYRLKEGSRVQELHGKAAREADLQSSVQDAIP